jgi:hypothetical protein
MEEPRVDIKVEKKTKRNLSSVKSYPRESFNDVINRVTKFYKDYCDKNPQEKNCIKREPEADIN